MLPPEVRQMLVDKAIADLGSYVPKSEAQRVFIELQKQRFEDDDTEPISTQEAVRMIDVLCNPQGPTAGDLGRAAFVMMLLGAERDALAARLREAGWTREGDDS